MSRLPPLKALRVFQVAAECGSFKLAAEKLHVTQAAVSQQIKLLEAFFDEPLFTRLNREIRPTPSALQLLPFIQQAFSLIEEGSKALEADAFPHQLKITSIPSFAAQWLIPKLGVFQAQQPDLSCFISTSLGKTLKKIHKANSLYLQLMSGLSLALVNKKFDELNEKERKVHEYFDPIHSHKNQHPNIQDIREDYLEDFQNYGFNRFQLKENQYDHEEAQKFKPSRQSVELYDQSIQLQKANKNIRPTTAKAKTSFQNKFSTGTYTQPQSKVGTQRPFTAKEPIKRPQTAMKALQLQSPSLQQLNQQRPYTATLSGKGDKYWVNTKKYDKQSKNKLVRNQSAQNNIICDNIYMSSELNPVHQHVISQRIQERRILIDGQGQAHNFTKDLNVFQPRKLSPTEEEKKKNYQSFLDQMAMIEDEKKNLHNFSHMKGKKSKPQNQPPTYKPEKKEKKSSLKESANFQDVEAEFKSHNNSTHENKKQQKSNQEEIEYKVEKNSQLRLQKMKEIKNLVMQFNPEQEQVFVDYQNKLIPPLKETQWDQMKRDPTIPFILTVVDLKTMNYINMENIKVENNKLVNSNLLDMAKFVNFKRIFDSLFLDSDHTDDEIISQPFFYIILHQTNNEGQHLILYEKFYYQGYLTTPLDKPIIDLLMVFYLRFIMAYDPSSSLSLDIIMKNSLFVTQKKEILPNFLQGSIQKISDKAFFLEDLSLKTKRYNIFPLMQQELIQNQKFQREYKLLSVEENDQFEQQLQQQQNQYQQSQRQSNRPKTANPNKIVGFNSQQDGYYKGTMQQVSTQQYQDIFNEQLNSYREIQSGTLTQNNSGTNFKPLSGNKGSIGNLSRPQTAKNANLQKFDYDLLNSNQYVLIQQQLNQQRIQNSFRQFSELQSVEDKINQFSVTTNQNRLGNTLNPSTSQQIVTEKYGSVNYRPKSGKIGFQTKSSKILQKRNLVNLKEQMVVSKDYDQFAKKSHVFKQDNLDFESKIHNQLQMPEKKIAMIPNVSQPKQNNYMDNMNANQNTAVDLKSDLKVQKNEEQQKQYLDGLQRRHFEKQERKPVKMNVQGVAISPNEQYYDENQRSPINDYADLKRQY